jgi:proteasome alpha subunit
MQQPMQHQLMGYDRAITMFSPDGRLLQVEYARKTVRQGNTTIGMVCSDGILILGDKKIIDSLMVPSSVEKVFKIDDHFGAAASGIISDARVLVERAQLKAQQHRVTYDTDTDIISIVKDICNLEQMTTQSGGLRPFGVSLIIAGIDNDGPRMYITDPAGIYFEYKAGVIGEGDERASELLREKYKKSLTIEKGIPVALEVLSEVVTDDLKAERIDCVYIKTDEKKFTRMQTKEISSYLSDIKSNN